MVEYAGDFLKQNVDPADITPGGSGDAAGIYGDVQDTYMHYNGSTYVTGATDGQIDFVVINGKRQIRWYGMPRSTSGNANINAANGDVVPLRDLWQQATTVAPSQATARAPFEKDAAAT